LVPRRARIKDWAYAGFAIVIVADCFLKTVEDHASVRQIIGASN
jgi:hypothetical protein